MILPILLSASLWLPLGTVYTYLAAPEIAFTQLGAVFKHQSSMFKHGAQLCKRNFWLSQVCVNGTQWHPEQSGK